MENFLVLIRHAKSDWSRAVSDHDRGLAARGRRQAPAIGTWLVEQQLVPDLVFVSTAQRARLTWNLLAHAMGDLAPANRECDLLYTGGAQDILDLLDSIPTSTRITALIGHNPTLEDIAHRLVGHPVRLPTSAVAVISLTRWSCEVDEGRLITCLRPADL